jgi:hypothetical protein
VAVLLLALCVLTVGFGGTSAEARAMASGQSVGAPGGFALEGSNGYSLFVVGVAAYRDRPASVLVAVDGTTDGAFYSAPAVVSDDSIQADLGDLGRIDVTFHPSGHTRTVHSRCGGKPISFDSGNYEGTIVFHGELGYTDVEATAAGGSVGFLLDVVCPGISGVSGPPSLPGAELNVNAGSRPGPHLKVVKNRPGARANFEVSVDEKRAGIRVTRFAGMFAPADSFEYDPKVQTATVRPPAPFSGVAQFHRNAKPGDRWTGNLTVDLPGREDVKLAGARFGARLAHARWSWQPPA